MAAPRIPKSKLPPPAKKSNAARKPNSQKTSEAVAVSFGRQICNDLFAAERREWLVTNGTGGFASGTIAGSATRRYHGYLIAALDPPAARTLLVGSVDEIVRVGGDTFELATHRWLSGAIAPEGYKLIQNFRLDGEIPVWSFRAGPALLEKRVWMQHGENTTFVRYSLLDFPGDTPIELELKVIINYRDFHSTTRAGSPPNEWRIKIEPVANGLRVSAFDVATPFYLKLKDAALDPQHIWYRDFLFSLERERGLDDHEDQLFAATFRARLQTGQALTLVFSTNPHATLNCDSVLENEKSRQAEVLSAAPSFTSSTSSASFRSAPALSQLVLAADQFIAARALPRQPDGKTIIAGYHWFGDWGRDTMIALPGLTLATGRAEIARQILLAFSRFVDRGMLPNNFPEAGGTPEYNTIDATLWYFDAIRQYFAATEDVATLKQLFPVLAKIIEAHVSGTRYNIHVDTDGLLYGGGPGVQLTWMDAKIGDWVVTPRTGKPVEINALWINALESMISFAQLLDKSSSDFTQLAARAKSSFAKFWNPNRNCCFDVLDAPGLGAGINSDASLRPNQIFAVSLVADLLTPAQQKSVVDTCADHLLTPFGLRSLAPGEPGYTGTYSGGPRERDAAYHQGTAWGWLLGPFALAHYRVYKDRAAALAFLEPLAHSIDRYGLGTLAEIFDGDPPHHPRGCIAQAWTVAELLRATQQLLSLPLR